MIEHGIMVRWHRHQQQGFSHMVERQFEFQTRTMSVASSGGASSGRGGRKRRKVYGVSAEETDEGVWSKWEETEEGVWSKWGETSGMIEPQRWEGTRNRLSVSLGLCHCGLFISISACSKSYSFVAERIPPTRATTQGYSECTL